MKYKFKKFWAECKDLAWLIYGFLLLFSLFLIPILANHFAEKKNPSDLTSEKGIEAKPFEYKSHKYILFEKTNVFGQISVVHDPDCCK